ncbi:MAG: L,D-transpeptidase family protein [Ascidiaceihabitans sp.]|nr:L,D-transpeptidase family protein [Ascidiaceihabitans sp.]
MKRRTFVLTSAMATLLAACGGNKSRFQTYNGPEVTYVIVNKGARKMYLLNESKVIKEYDFVLGFAPIGDKFFEGDGKTPEGTYYIDRRNPNSRFHLSLGISYPNAQDRAEAKALGKPPGGDIFIHGQESPLKKNKGDWTWGCISISNKEMESVYAMVKNGTPIQINA